MSTNELMYMNWQEMIKPEKVQVSSTPFYGKFVCEPLEPGFGITIGNSLRRIILSSLYGAAIVSVKFEDVMHEFSSIPGVLEDVSEIILNLKEVRFKVSDPEPKEVSIKVKGERKITAGDIVCGDGRCEVLNPDLHIAEITEENCVFKARMTVKVGKGYALAETNKDAPVVNERITYLEGLLNKTNTPPAQPILPEPVEEQIVTNPEVQVNPFSEPVE